MEDKMTSVAEWISEATNLAIKRITDDKLRVFMRALTFDADNNGSPKTASIITHFHYWTHFCSDEEIEAMRQVSVEGLVPIITSWVENALNLGMLVATDPPLAGKWNLAGSI